MHPCARPRGRPHHQRPRATAQALAIWIQTPALVIFCLRVQIPHTEISVLGGGGQWVRFASPQSNRRNSSLSLLSERTMAGVRVVSRFPAPLHSQLSPRGAGGGGGVTVCFHTHAGAGKHPIQSLPARADSPSTLHHQCPTQGQGVRGHKFVTKLTHQRCTVVQIRGAPPESGYRFAVRVVSCVDPSGSGVGRPFGMGGGD